MRTMSASDRTELRHLRGQPDPYDTLSAALATDLTSLFRVFAADLQEEVKAAMAVSAPPPVVAPDTAVTVSMKEAARRLDVGVTTARRLIAQNELESLWIGEGRRVVPVEALEEYVARLRASQGSVPAPSPQPCAPPEPSRPSSGRRLARSGLGQASAAT